MLLVNKDAIKIDVWQPCSLTLWVREQGCALSFPSSVCSFLKFPQAVRNIPDYTKILDGDLDLGTAVQDRRRRRKRRRKRTRRREEEEEEKEEEEENSQKTFNLPKKNLDILNFLLSVVTTCTAKRRSGSCSARICLPDQYRSRGFGDGLL